MSHTKLMAFNLKHKISQFSQRKQPSLPIKWSIREKCDCKVISTGSEGLLSPIHLVPLNLTTSSLQMIPMVFKVYVWISCHATKLWLLSYFLSSEIWYSPFSMIIVHFPPSVLLLSFWSHFCTICCHLKNDCKSK